MSLGVDAERAGLSGVVALGGEDRGQRYPIFECVLICDEWAVLRAPLVFEPGERLELELEFTDGGVIKSAALVESVTLGRDPEMRVSFIESEQGELAARLKRAHDS